MNEREFDDFVESICDRFGFCGCGGPEFCLEFIRDGLTYIDSWKGEYDAGKYKEWAAREAVVFKDRGAAMFFYYWAAKEGLTDHGGSVPGWLNEKGKALLIELGAVNFDINAHEEES